jgi:hypothetical protein
MSSPGRLCLVLLSALLLLPAASSGTTGSGLFGTVMKGPIRPVCRVGVPCDAAVEVTLVFSRAGRDVARVHSSKTGHYRIALAPGSYDVRPTVRIGLQKLPKPHGVHVRAGHWDRINFFFDTGIR